VPAAGFAASSSTSTSSPRTPKAQKIPKEVSNIPTIYSSTSDTPAAAEDDNIPVNNIPVNNIPVNNILVNNIPVNNILENGIRDHSNPIDRFPSEVHQEFHPAAHRPARQLKRSPSPK